MKLRIPVTGGTVEVADEKAAKYLAKGFQIIDEKPQKAEKAEAPKKKAAPKKAAKKAEPEEE